MNSNADHDPWSVYLGRWGRLTLRMHIVCPLFFLVTLALCMRDDLLRLGLLSMAVLAASVVAHELGHLLATRWLGVRCDCIVLWPFGGVAPAVPWASPRAGLLAVFAGPAVNLLICLVCGALLWLLTGATCWKLLNPLYPEGLTGAVSVAGLCEFVFWINWVLFVINLVPAYPFDGGRLIYYSLAGLWPHLSDSQLRLIVGQAARAFAIGLLLLAWLTANVDAHPSPVPTWLALALLGVLVFYAARQHGRADTAAGVSTDASNQHPPADSPRPGGDDRLESPDPAGSLTGWIDERRKTARRHREEIEAQEEQQVDEILARLHEVGLENLKREDRELLERVSARYRGRLQNQ